MAQSLMQGAQCYAALAPSNQLVNHASAVNRLMQNNVGVPTLVHRCSLSRNMSAASKKWSGCSRTSAISAPPIRAKSGDKWGESASAATDFGSSRIAQRILTGTLAAALILLPADGGNSMEASTSSPVSLPLAAAVTESVSADSAADLFAQLKGYASAENEAKATGKLAPPLKTSDEDPITAAVESVKVAEDLDVSKVPEVHGLAKVNIAKITQDVETPANTAKPGVAEGVQSSEGQTRAGGLLERLKKGADAGRSGFAGSLAESKQLLGAGRSKVGEIVGRVKEGVSDKIGGGKTAPESLPVESKAAPVEASGSPGGLKGWFDSWTSGKPSETKAETRGLFSGGSQTAQPPAKQARGFFQAKPPPKEEKTGLAGAWQSLTSLDFLPDNVKGGALTVKSAVSFVLTILSLVLSVFAKALGVAADLIGIIARGL